MASVDEITEVFQRFEYPLSAVFIGKQIKPQPKTKKEVNSTLYKMEKNGLVEKLEMSPIIWRIIGN